MQIWARDERIVLQWMFSSHKKCWKTREDHSHCRWEYFCQYVRDDSFHHLSPENDDYNYVPPTDLSHLVQLVFLIALSILVHQMQDEYGRKGLKLRDHLLTCISTTTNILELLFNPLHWYCRQMSMRIINKSSTLTQRALNQLMQLQIKDD